MKSQYDFSQGKRGAVLRLSPGKTRITIRVDDDILGWFRAQVNAAGGGSYQTLINDALRQFVDSKETSLEDTLRRVLREELPNYARRKPRSAKRIRSVRTERGAAERA
jgi:Arc/MetJ family transcription regulator